MKLTKKVTATALTFLVALSGCKEVENEIASPACKDQSTASDSSKCPRHNATITRSKPQSWSMDGDAK